MEMAGTAGLNHVLAMLPARDVAEFTHFPASEVAWIRRWLSLTEDHFRAFHHTIPLPALDRGPDAGGSFHDKNRRSD
jgi:hypothetical protein